MDEQTALEISNRGAKLRQEGKIEAAIELYQRAIELAPNYHKYYYQLANVLCDLGQLVQATIYYQQAIELDANNSWYHYSLGEVLARQNKTEAAIDCYHRAIYLNPTFAWSYYNLARILHQQGKINEAIKYYKQAIKFNSDYSWSHHFIGDILTEQKLNLEAIKYYQKAIELNPNFNLSFYQLGYNLQQQGRIIEAIECYQRAIELEPNHCWSYYYLAEAFATTKKNNLAIECYRQAIDLNPRALQIYFKLGQLLLNCPKAELETYQQSLIAKSDLIQAYFAIGLGQAWQAKQEFDRAIECYQQAIKIDPNLELPYKLLQYIPLTIERIDILIKFYREITEFQPNIALAWGNLGDVLSEKYRLESAIDCYRKSCYYRTIDKNRNLADFNWDLPKIDAPDFIIIGAAKCGTTSLFEYLKHHPQILLPHKKEIDFFSKYFDRGKQWYLAHFPAISDRQEFITGEATTHYFDTYQVDRKIKQMFPKTKLIIILRNPIERTISDYYHHVNRGVEQRNLQEIIISTRSYLEAARETDLIYTPNEFDYILKSIYFPKIQRWMQQFARQQILILESELFFQDPKTIMREVFQFLELDFYLASEYNRYNIGSYSTIKTDLKQNLSEIFQTYNRQLQKFLNLNFSW